MKVLSLFDGISCGMVALERSRIPVDRYVAYEIDKYAIQVSTANYPQIEHCGDVTIADFTQYKGFDLLIGGSPCQGFSFAGKQLNFSDDRSKLFFEFVRVLRESKPKYFLLENVVMKKEYQDVISKILGVEPILINSNSFSAQNRPRLYWTNFKIDEILIEKNVSLKDVFQGDLEHRQIHINHPETIRKCKTYYQYDQNLLGHNSQDQRYFDINTKCNTLLVSSSSIPKIKVGEKIWLAHPIECELLQTLPKNYTNSISSGRRYSAIGNGWTVDVIAHILSYLKVATL